MMMKKSWHAAMPMFPVRDRSSESKASRLHHAFFDHTTTDKSRDATPCQQHTPSRLLFTAKNSEKFHSTETVVPTQKQLKEKTTLPYPRTTALPTQAKESIHSVIQITNSPPTW